MNKELDDSVALRIVVGDSERDVSFRELCLSNNMSQEALVSLLIKKKIIKPEEILEEIEKVRKERYRASRELFDETKSEEMG